MCVDKNPPERENSKINLKRTSTKLSVKPQQLLLPKINGKILYLAYALHGNDDESQLKITFYHYLEPCLSQKIVLTREINI